MTATGDRAPARSPAFPDGFVWGAATAAYQVEGAARDEGRGPSIWDTFAHTPGKVADGHTGDVACDHYRRHAGDVRLMRELGLAAYRFSVSWSRVLPAGAGAVNPAGLDFYDRLVDELLAAGIAPYVTLYHWDLPQALEDAGGWAERETAYRFADYVRVVADRLGDRVATWMTVNEPWVAAILGYGIGVHAPGRSSPADAFRAGHHLLLAHGLGAAALRGAVRGAQGGGGEIALTLNVAPVMTPEQLDDPAHVPSAADAEAVGRVDALLNRQFLEPALRGAYPAQVLSIVERIAGLGHIRDGDLGLINQPIDLLGVNYYNPSVVRARPDEPANPAFPGSEGIEFCRADVPTTAMGWPIVPTGLYQLLVRLARDYPGVGLIVAENGAAFHDVVTGDRVHDADRTAYLDGHLRAAHAAIEAGVDLRGYLVWSLLDNFEWADGYHRKFGIVHVDFATQRRLVKDSGLWYREVIKRNGLRVDDAARRPTLEEVAARAGVSRSTVSRVINGEARVSPESRSVVLHAVSELGYVPNSAARSLATRQAAAARPAGTIALVVADPPAGPADADPMHAALVQAAGRALDAAGKRVTLAFADTADAGRRLSRRLADAGVDAALLVPAPGAGPPPDDLAGPGIPVIALGRPAPPARVPYVAVDDSAGAAAAVRHLLAGGRRAIAAIGGPPGAVAAADRLAGCRAVLDDAGRQPIVMAGDLGPASGAAAARRLLAAHPELDAIFAVNDLMAIGALHALRTAGRRVPADVAVVGFDDIAAAAYTVPPLTTVRAPVAGQARAAVRLLLAALDGKPADSLTLPAELVVRDSA
ncbi:MAG TPA: GH1 family beta-glucosidase [Streptosporangiaceae bacterium]|nr:GH1 family beta-glucosidase [Streptosporangiaceae bacterium]